MMDSAKVDIRKLELLNDRINQCIDALAQVRMSVHGLSHASQNSQLGQTFGTAGMAASQQNPSAGVAYAVPGLSHSSVLAGAAPMFPQGNVGAAVGYGTAAPVNPLGVLGPLGAVHPAVGTPWGAAGIAPFGGLSHTGAETIDALSRPLWADPLLAARIAQTFPYAQVALPPVVTTY